MTYDKVFITSLPSFYKIRLWNEVSKQIRIFVLFTESKNTSRNNDFCKGDIQFEHTFVFGGAIAQIKTVVTWFMHNSTSELVFGGWDKKASLIMSLLSPKAKNATILESTVFESQTTGIKAVIKKMFMSRMAKVYAPGTSNAKLAETLGSKGNIVITGGCGILNYIKQPEYSPKNEVRKFLFVGRLIPVKNLEFLIRVFNSLPQFELTIVGFGALESSLRSIANGNIVFTGAVSNENLPAVYQRHDVFILPSKSETWGLVVEEALNNGLPVIVSNRVGCGADLVTPETGFIFEYNNESSLCEAIVKISNVSCYNKLAYNVSKLNFFERASRQINSFVK